MGAAKNCTIPKIAVVNPAKKYQYFGAIPLNKKDDEVGSVKIIGIIGITIPIPIISSTRVKNKIVRALRSINKKVMKIINNLCIIAFFATL